MKRILGTMRRLNATMPVRELPVAVEGMVDDIMREAANKGMKIVDCRLLGYMDKDENVLKLRVLVTDNGK